MSYYVDMSPYEYGSRTQPGVVHVGWLDGEHPYSRGVVPSELLDKMMELAKAPVELYRGFHACEICEWPPEEGAVDDHAFLKWSESRRSNGEIRVTANGVTYAAPILITHYIEQHSYLPPEAFLKAVEAWPHKENDDTCGQKLRNDLEALFPSNNKKHWWQFWKKNK